MAIAWIGIGSFVVAARPRVGAVMGIVNLPKD
jgi:hypothetical protein